MDAQNVAKERHIMIQYYNLTIYFYTMISVLPDDLSFYLEMALRETRTRYFEKALRKTRYFEIDLRETRYFEMASRETGYIERDLREACKRYSDTKILRDNR